MSEKKPEGIYFPVVRKLCPICGKVAYSLCGEHPQCATLRSDLAFKAKQQKRAERQHTALNQNALKQSAFNQK